MSEESILKKKRERARKKAIIQNLVAKYKMYEDSVQENKRIQLSDKKPWKNVFADRVGAQNSPTGSTNL